MLLQRLALRAVVACALLLAPVSARAWEGRVSWYGSEHGQAKNDVACSRRTVGHLAGRYNPQGMTAAHWTLPCGTRVQVTDLATGRSVEVTVNDRGPHPRLHRTLDLAQGAAERLGIVHRGVIHARLAIIGTPGAGRLRLAASR
ncbi:septal ring lytic transglycosylase RlpA family protein [Methylobacterium mesophilicum SR1.6/6]|uniref:Septal ring lytic transglycosylase RlpA family protein n=1 Tax=Methylobacterium mesophilicum SR1.6/6 TaxID=908290 RepID=A0A6B9FUD8_9HYPH|nr:septal ring lytic transglycosylase RlpA family protein [Methylobacterium mesophilicum]QGY05489.1 septal ring lytic transglycosylase RlpA family protein [Methylobacterium mesophilicum SR1.6/6]